MRAARSWLLSMAASLAWLAPAQAQSAAPAWDAELLQGLKLRNIGPANMSGRIVDIAVDEKDPYVIYAASATGGLWKTADNGVSWAPVFEHEAVHSIGAIAVSRSHPEVVWVGTGERANRQSSSWGDGVYKSVDAGKTWTNLGLRDSHHVGRIAIDPVNPEIVFVAAMGHLWGPNQERGLYRTRDGGKTWQRVLFVDADTGVVDVAIDPGDPSVVYAASFQRRRQAYGYHGGGPGSALWKSTDAGNSWRRLTAGLPGGDYGRIGISIFRKDPRIVYVCIEQGLRYNASTEYDVYEAGVYRSLDRGESWTQMSSWNPRPTYASQILVDPNDDRRVYMLNNYSYSDDGGKTFKDPEQSLHGDDRLVWVDPKDSRHLIKADDGGLGISYDRGLKWQFVTSLPVSQYYRVALDMRRPFWVYGGLQDNGNWAGPSATPYAWGILNEDWIRLGGGDGFWTVPEPDGRHVYVSSQYLGLTRFDTRTRESKAIRPAPKEGEAPKLGNWGAPEPRVGSYTAPANWDAPLLLSAHDGKTLYAGMRVLWKSTDRGESWSSLGDLTTGVDRRSLRIMGQLPSPKTHSLDDGIPYYPTISALAESPLTPGLLWVGTDDGNLQLTRDDGRTWTNVAPRLPGLPRSSYVAGIEASRHRESTVYVAVDNHRSDDFANYLYRSDDLGRSWRSITGDMPPSRVVRSVHEDPKNPELLYAATEFGLFLSPDAGRHWLELKGNLPRLAVNHLAIHPRDNDLVLATHGRGIWILDNIGCLQQLTPQVLASDAHLFSVEPAEMLRRSNPKAHSGDMIFKGENPPDGAIIDYYLRQPGGQPTLTIHDAAGALVASLEPTAQRGINRVVWDLRHPKLAPQAFRYMNSGRPPQPPKGPFVMPGEYVARLGVGNATLERRFRVEDDARLDVSPEERRAWHDAVMAAYRSYQQATALLERAQRATQAAGAPGEARELHETVVELQARVGSLYAALNGVTARPTADQSAQLAHLSALLAPLAARVEALPR